MAKRLMILLVALLVLGFVVAGCGDDESDGGGTTTEEVVTDTDTVTDDETVTEDDTVTDDVTDTDTVTEETETQDSGGATPPAGDQSGASKPSVAACKKSIGQSPQLSDSLKEDLQELCETAPGASQKELRARAREICERLVDETLPEGTPGREQALEGCAKGPSL